MIQKILVTGFDPFGEDTVNPSIEAVKRLPDAINGVKIIKLEIPTIRYKAVEAIDKAIQAENPDVILSVGQAGGRTDITVERVGINQDDFRIKDNAGNQPIDDPIYENGKDAYFTTIPIKAIVEKIKSKNIPASVSNTAGTFVCNHVLYGVGHLIHTKYPTKKSGFIHIPYMPEQVLNRPGQASMNLSTVVEALHLALEAIIEHSGEDTEVSGGTIA